MMRPWRRITSDRACGVPYAITLKLDAAAAAPVVAMWETLAARGVSDDAIALGYPPHLTLAVFPNSADPSRLLAVTRAWADERQPLTITLASLGLFPGSPGALFLAPVVTAALIEMHAGLLTSLAGEPVDPHYQRGQWMPHVTLARDLTDPAAAIAALNPLSLPISAMLDAAEIVHFRPVQILASHHLATA
jgi:2'-5' RNA ligase